MSKLRCRTCRINLWFPLLSFRYNLSSHFIQGKRSFHFPTPDSLVVRPEFPLIDPDLPSSSDKAPIQIALRSSTIQISPRRPPQDVSTPRTSRPVLRFGRAGCQGVFERGNQDDCQAEIGVVDCVGSWSFDQETVGAR